jgi:hypothetical protein
VWVAVLAAGGVVKIQICLQLLLMVLSTLLLAYLLLLLLLLLLPHRSPPPPRVPYNFRQHHLAAQTASEPTNTKPAPGSTEQPRADLAYHGYHHKDKALPLCDGTCQGGDCKVTYEAFMDCSPGYY